MKKKISPQQLEELSFMRDWILFLYEHMFPEGEFRKHTFHILNEQINKAFESQELRGMRMAFRDTNEVAGDLPSSELEKLNLLLREKFGTDLTVYDKKRLIKIKGIIKRGYVKNDEEFYLLRGREDEIYANNEEEAEVLRNLMYEYEIKTSSVK